MREEPCPCGRCRQGIRRLRRSGQRSPPVREELRLYVRGSCGFPAIPVRAESARRTAGAGSGGIRRQRAASGVPSAILRHSLRWFWRPVCFWKAFRTPCDAAPVLGRARSRLRIGHRIATRLGHRAGRRTAGNGGIKRQRAASGIPSAILRHSLRCL